MKKTTIKINKVKIKIERFDVITANEKLADLIGFFAPIFGSILGDTLSDAFFGSQPVEQAQNDVKQMFADKWDKLQRINSKSIRSLMDLLLDEDHIMIQTKDGEYVKYSEEALNDVFADYPQGLIELMIKVAEVNFKDFFTEIKDGLSNLIFAGITNKLTQSTTSETNQSTPSSN